MFIENLINAGLLEASGTSYKTTQKGMEALGHIVALRTLLGPATSSED
jgi:predicted transcriptional regulator